MVSIFFWKPLSKSHIAAYSTAVPWTVFKNFDNDYERFWNCSSEGKGVLRITLLTPLHVHVIQYFNCALTFTMPLGLATSAWTAPKDWSWEKLIAKSSNLVDAAWAHLVAHPTLAAEIPVEHRSPRRPQLGLTLPLCPAFFSSSLGLPW